MTRSAETLVKGLRLLSAIVADDGRSTLAQIASRSDLPLPTAHRLAMTLVSERFLERVRKGLFLPGPALGVLSAQSSVAGRIAACLRQPLARLAQVEGVFAHFGVLEDGMVTYLVKESGAGLRSNLFTAENIQLEAYCSAVGKVLLAALPDHELDAYLANGPFVALTRQTLTDPQALRNELVAVRSDGVAFDRFEVCDDLFCVGVPVCDDAGRVIGGVSASMIGEMHDPDRLLRLRRRLRAIVRGETFGSGCP